MAKKKKKFKKFSKAQILQELVKTDVPETIQTTVLPNITAIKTAEPMGTHMNYVRTDLKKIAVILTLILLILLAIIIINQQTDWLRKLSDDLIKILHLNQ